jgi:hypothetical protein
LADLQTQLCCMVNYICHKVRITTKWCVYTLLNINNCTYWQVIPFCNG